MIAKCLSATFALLLVATLLVAQANSGKKSYVFKGTVTEVDAKTKNLVVSNEKIEGWMGAMTMMKYDVDNLNPETVEKRATTSKPPSMTAISSSTR